MTNYSEAGNRRQAAQENPITKAVDDFRVIFPALISYMRQVAGSVLERPEKPPSLKKAIEAEVKNVIERESNTLPTYDEGLTYQKLSDLKEKYFHYLTERGWENLEARIALVYQEWNKGVNTELGEVEFVFTIHQRTRTTDIEQGQSYGDSAAFCPELGILSEISMDSDLATTALINSLPPFRAANIALHVGDQVIPGAVVCIPIDLDVISKSARDKRELAALISRLKGGAFFINQTLGAQVMGLGATIPALTNMGVTLKNFISEHTSKENEFITTSGHAMTTALMVETMYAGAAEKNIAVADSTIAIIGCGSIGSAFGQVLYAINGRPHPAKVILYDPREKSAVRLKEEIMSSRYGMELMKKDPNFDVEIISAGNCESPFEYICANADIVVSAATSTTPLTFDGIDPSAMRAKVWVDDSQPTYVARGNKVTDPSVYWPIADGMNGYHRQLVRMIDGKPDASEEFNYGPKGLPPVTVELGDNQMEHRQAMWGCELELILLVIVRHLKENLDKMDVDNDKKTRIKALLDLHEPITKAVRAENVSGLLNLLHALDEELGYKLFTVDSHTLQSYGERHN